MNIHFQSPQLIKPGLYGGSEGRHIIIVLSTASGWPITRFVCIWLFGSQLFNIHWTCRINWSADTSRVEPKGEQKRPTYNPPHIIELKSNRAYMEWIKLIEFWDSVKVSQRDLPPSYRRFWQKDKGWWTTRSREIDIWTNQLRYLVSFAFACKNRAFVGRGNYVFKDKGLFVGSDKSKATLLHHLPLLWSISISGFINPSAQQQLLKLPNRTTNWF